MTTYFEVIKSIKARNVENPPLNTAGPMLNKVFSTLIGLRLVNTENVQFY